MKNYTINELFDHPDLIAEIDNPSEQQQLAAVYGNPRTLFLIKDPPDSVMYSAVDKDASIISEIENPSLRCQLSAIRQDETCFLLIDNPHELIKEEIVSEHDHGIGWIKNPSKKLKLKAVEKNHRALKYIKDADYNVQYYAIAYNGLAIKYCDNPLEELQFLAIRDRVESIHYIQNPTYNVIYECVQTYPDYLHTTLHPTGLGSLVRQKIDEHILVAAIEASWYADCVFYDKMMFHFSSNITDQDYFYREIKKLKVKYGPMNCTMKI